MHRYMSTARVSAIFFLDNLSLVIVESEVLLGSGGRKIGCKRGGKSRVKGI